MTVFRLTFFRLAFFRLQFFVRSFSSGDFFVAHFLSRIFSYLLGDGESEYGSDGWIVRATQISPKC